MAQWAVPAFQSSDLPAELGIVRLRECPVPKSLALCKTAKDAADYWRRHIATNPGFNPDCENLAVIFLNARSRIKGHQIVAIGTIDASLVHAREVFRLAIVTAASAIIVMHNHPSGDPEPSEEDRKSTRLLGQAGAIVGINLLDHVIVAGGRHVSIEPNQVSR